MTNGERYFRNIWLLCVALHTEDEFCLFGFAMTVSFIMQVGFQYATEEFYAKR